jgi:NADH dehydrogenase FAD-containing subunit
VIGGGAAGVELSGDIKEDYKDKHVILIHPREILVNDKVNESFQATVKDRLKFLGVETVLGE